MLNTLLLSSCVDADRSQIEQRKKQAFCKEGASVRQALNPGRDCMTDNQCKSSICHHSRCQGLSVNEYCSAHQDCNAGMYCNT